MQAPSVCKKVFSAFLPSFPRAISKSVWLYLSVYPCLPDRSLISLSVCRPVCLSIFVFVAICVSICLSLCLSVHPFIYSLPCLSLRLSYTFTGLTGHLCVCLSVQLICPSVLSTACLLHQHHNIGQVCRSHRGRVCWLLSVVSIGERGPTFSRWHLVVFVGALWLSDPPSVRLSVCPLFQMGKSCPNGTWFYSLLDNCVSCDKKCHQPSHPRCTDHCGKV